MTSPREWWHAHDHPVWGLAKLVVIACAAVGISYVNSSSFDMGEVITALGSVTVTKLLS
jgi:hypothetical protein